MTSKEFIKLLISQKPKKMTKQEKECYDNLLQVLKDLEIKEKQDKILEILSNHLFGIDGTISIEINDCDNKEEFNLIKEWLDNDK